MSTRPDRVHSASLRPASRGAARPRPYERGKLRATPMMTGGRPRGFPRPAARPGRPTRELPAEDRSPKSGCGLQLKRAAPIREKPWPVSFSPPAAGGTVLARPCWRRRVPDADGARSPLEPTPAGHREEAGHAPRGFRAGRRLEGSDDERPRRWSSPLTTHSDHITVRHALDVAMGNRETPSRGLFCTRNLTWSNVVCRLASVGHSSRRRPRDGREVRHAGDGRSRVYTISRTNFGVSVGSSVSRRAGLPLVSAHKRPSSRRTFDQKELDAVLRVRASTHERHLRAVRRQTGTCTPFSVFLSREPRSRRSFNAGRSISSSTAESLMSITRRPHRRETATNRSRIDTSRLFASRRSRPRSRRGGIDRLSSIQVRLPERPLEQLPLSRRRAAVDGAR